MQHRLINFVILCFGFVFPYPSVTINTRTKKESIASRGCLQTLEANIILTILTVQKMKLLVSKDTVIKRLQEEN